MADRSGLRQTNRRLLPAFILAALIVPVAAGIWITERYLGPDTRLLNALEHHDMRAAEIALQQGADPNLKVEQCWPTHLLSDHVSFFYWKVRNPRQYGDYPVLLAETFRHDSAAVQLLLAHGADPNAKCYGTNAFRIARSNGFRSNEYRVISALLENAGARE